MFVLTNNKSATATCHLFLTQSPYIYYTQRTCTHRNLYEAFVNGFYVSFITLSLDIPIMSATTNCPTMENEHYKRIIAEAPICTPLILTDL